MSENIDRKTQEMLLQAMVNMKRHTEDMRVKREGKLWENLMVSYSFKDLLTRLTKNELGSIRQNLNLKGLSSLKKKDLVESLASEIVNNANKTFSLFDDCQYKLIKRIVENNGVIDNFDIDKKKIEYFCDRGIIFSGTLDGNRVLVVPPELVSEFKKLDNNEYQKIIQRNTTWIRLAKGLLFYYGTLSFIQLIDIVAHLWKKEKIDSVKFIPVINEALNYYREIMITSEGYSNYRVFDPARVKQEHKMRPNLSFYPFSYEQVFKAGAPGFVDKNFAFRRFSKFLTDNYDITSSKADEIIEECIYAIKIDEPTSHIMELMQGHFEIINMKMAQEFTDQIVFLRNNTRQWFLKGYTPEEIMIQDKKKVGRNDPCPCGIGKKYKKCCGK